MRYTLDTDVPSEVLKYSNSHLDSFIKFLINTNKIKSRTSQRVQISSIALRVFFYNMYLNVKSNKTTMEVTLDKAVYNKAYICNGKEGRVKVSYQYTCWVIEYLTSLGMGGLEKGGVSFESYKMGGVWKYKMVDTKKSIYTIPNSLQKELLDLDFKMRPIRNVIVMRDSKKKDSTFRLPIAYHSIKDALLSGNELFTDIVVLDPVTNKVYPLQLKKIFNTCFNKGGRMYDMGIQNLSKTERHRLTIDDKETCVHDFKAFETSLIYSIQGERMQGDPYKVEIFGYNNTLLREVGKMIMTRIYYCKSKEELNASVSKTISDKFNLEQLVEDGKIPEKRIPVGQIIDLLLDKHEVIAEHFFGEGDYDPSHLGSKVMDYIFESMLQNHKTPIIPVFDEVICDEEYAYEVHELMKKAFVHVVGTDMNCMIVREK